MPGLSYSEDAYIDALVSRLREEGFPALTPGSPAYVRRLRDRAALAALNGLCANLDGAKAFDRQDSVGDLCDVVSITAREFADAFVKATGYEVPEESP